MYQHTVVAVKSPFDASFGAVVKRGAVTEARCSSSRSFHAGSGLDEASAHDHTVEVKTDVQKEV